MVRFISTVRANLDKMHRYVRLRKKLLGLEELHFYDVYAPMVSGVDARIPYADARETVYQAMAPLGSDYQAILREGLDSRWIDVYENVGKRSGGYMAGSLVHPYILLNYQDDLYSTCWTRRNLNLSYVLTAAQYNMYISRTYFYRPVYWSSGFRYSIYTRYTDRSYYYYSRPSVYTTYRGGHSWRSNGGKSWYKGRTYSSAHKLTPVRTGTTNHSGHSVTTTPKPSKPTNQGHTVTAPKPSTGTASHGRPTTNKKPTTSAGKPATSRPSRGTGTSGSTTVKPSGSFSGTKPVRSTGSKPSTTTQKTTPTKGFSGKR